MDINQVLRERKIKSTNNNMQSRNRANTEDRESVNATSSRSPRQKSSRSLPRTPTNLNNYSSTNMSLLPPSHRSRNRSRRSPR